MTMMVSHMPYDLHHNHEDSDFFNAFFAYEAGHITAEEFMQSPVQDWLDDTGMDDTDGNDDDGDDGFDFFDD